MNDIYENNTIHINSGSSLSFSFKLYDDSNNLIEDKLNYLSFLSIKADLYNKKKSKYILTGNTCNFAYGECIMNNLKIIASEEQFTLKFNIENSNKIIIKDFNEFNIDVLKCNINEITLYLKNKLITCIKPVCNSDCPVNTTASCLPPSEIINSKNTQKYNKCVCNSGYRGINCDEKIFIDLR